VLAVEHQLAVLVVDRWPGRNLTGACGKGGDASPAIAGRYISSALIPVA
jgi:hypothetical protein